MLFGVYAGSTVIIFSILLCCLNQAIWALVVASTALICTKLFHLAITKKFHPNGRIDGKTVIVTGANTGIGFEASRIFARLGARVILACRNVKAAQDARDRIVQQTGNRNVVVKHLDLNSLSSVRSFAKDILETEERLDILVNNAAVALQKYVLNADCLESQMATNFFSPFLMTNLLMGLMQKSAPSRVVNLTSITHKYGVIDFDNLNFEQDNCLFGQGYYNSKLAQILFTKELANRLSNTGVSAYCVHPGLVNTNIFRNLWQPCKLLINFITSVACKSSEEGAQTIIYCALGDNLTSGRYYSDCKEVTPSDAACDMSTAQKLWSVSETLVGLKEGERLLHKCEVTGG